MAPFHPLRDETRVLAARVLAALAVFCVIALALLSGSSAGPLANAEAQDPQGNAYGLENGHGNGALKGGGAKQDPVDPVAPEVQQPTTAVPVPAPTGAIDPANGGGKGGNTGSAAPAPTGATKGNANGNGNGNGNGNQSGASTPVAETPVTEVAPTPVAEQPAAPAERTSIEADANPGPNSPLRIEPAVPHQSPEPHERDGDEQRRRGPLAVGHCPTTPPRRPARAASSRSAAPREARTAAPRRRAGAAPRART